MERFARMYAEAGSAVLVWSMGMTQHRFGTDNVRAIVNLALARGNIGRAGAGLMPIRGHSGVQGGAEMGAYATVLPGGIPITPESAGELSLDVRASTSPVAPGLTAAEMVAAAASRRARRPVLERRQLPGRPPGPALTRESLERVPLRVHQDIVVSSQMLVDPRRGGDPASGHDPVRAARRRDGDDHRAAHRVLARDPRTRGSARLEPSGTILIDLARRVDPDRAGLIEFADAQAIREEIARVVPFYQGIQDLRTTGDQVQWGGPACARAGCSRPPTGKAHFTPVSPPEMDVPEGRFLLSTRRGKQFNTIVHKAKDPLTGAKRNAVFVAGEDASRLGLREGDPVTVRSENGELAARVKVAAIKPGNLQVFFPEGNALLATGRYDPECRIPDYTAVVELLTPSKT